MRKLLLLIFIVSTFIFFACEHTSTENNIIPTELNIEDANQVQILYGCSSYIMLSNDEDKIKKLTNQFNNLSFESTDEEIDLGTELSVIFSYNGETIKVFKVDKSGVFKLGSDRNYFKISSGSFDYEIVRDIYRQSNVKYSPLKPNNLFNFYN